MASMKAEKLASTQAPLVQAIKEPAKATEAKTKPVAAKPAPKLEQIKPRAPAKVQVLHRNQPDLYIDSGGRHEPFHG
ncbi:hypothetical protein AXF42_Ash019501 [Apostasia shenzhenica]|uniref:Uncharacterized protein n=1 Tax=Apostasia shenzhenica TaxID=1088818 RepID=A0A2I0A089_9ASPA|nr:hypothetical protein AXF42_Ash019501 [Apostasia shenzhenica]